MNGFHTASSLALMSLLLAGCNRAESQSVVEEASARALLSMQWAKFKSAFLTDGRIQDNYNDNVSHSEGQSYGMLFATYANDPAAFEEIWSWTKASLGVREDALLAWKYVEQASGAGQIPDPNNASDGDICIAWALLRASQLWDKPEYAKEANLILNDIREKLIIKEGDHTVLLPGVEGFEKETGVVLNLSYWLYPAFAHFAEVTESDEEKLLWRSLMRSGMWFTEKAQFGKYQLPPDWLRVQGEALSPAEGWEPLFSYDAIRVPLFLYWGERLSELPGFSRALRELFDSVSLAEVPAKLTLSEKAPSSSETANLGMREVYRKTLFLPAADGNPDPSVSLEEGYYSSALRLLTLCAYIDVLR